MNDESKSQDTFESVPKRIEVPVEADFSSEVANVREETALGLVTVSDNGNPSDDDGYDCYLSEYVLSDEADGEESDGLLEDESGIWSDTSREDVDYLGDDGVAEAMSFSDDETYIFGISEVGEAAYGFSSSDKSASESNLAVLSHKVKETFGAVSDSYGKEEDSAPSLDRSGIGIGAVVNNRYTVTEKMSVTAGESELYLCESEGSRFVLKLYKRKDAVKPEIRSALAAIESPYVASPIDVGDIDGFPYEIIPYYKNGSLKGKKYSFKQLREFVIPELNEMLHVIHSCGILHRDIKPSNIMLRDDGMSFALIDFGISSLINDGEEAEGEAVGGIGLTPLYSAPEALHSQYACTLSDCYSLGITVYELYVGEPPLVSKTREERDRYLSENPVPIPDYFPRELSELILGLTYRDISNRNDKDNPDNRWSYGNVLAWCRGEKQAVPGLSEADKDLSIAYGGADFDIGDYIFCGLHYQKSSALARALGANPEAAIEVLANGELLHQLESACPYLARHCERIIERTGDVEVALRCIISDLADSSCEVFYWRGRSFSSAAGLGEALLASLRGGRKDERAYWGSILEKHLLSAHLAVCKDCKIGDHARDAASNAEYLYCSAESSEKTRTMCLYTAAFLFCGKAELVLPNGICITDLSELRKHMQSLYESSYDELCSFVDGIIGEGKELNPQFEAWLAFYGYDKTVEGWKIGR